MAPEPLDELLQLRISATEKAMLNDLAERHGVKLSQCVRRLIREAHEAEFGRAPKRQ
jgi:hypothetical protein